MMVTQCNIVASLVSGARISAVDAAADASGLSLFVSAPSVSASGSASACTVCKRL